MNRLIKLIAAILICAMLLCGCSSTAVSGGSRKEETDKAEEVIVPDKSETEEISETEPEPEQTEPEAEEEPETEESADEAEEPEGIRPEVKKAIDDYEAFIDSYCEFLEAYDKDDMSAALKALSLLAEYEESSESMDALEEDLTTEELAYYIEVLGRCEAKLIRAGA